MSQTQYDYCPGSAQTDTCIVLTSGKRGREAKEKPDCMVRAGLQMHKTLKWMYDNDYLRGKIKEDYEAGKFDTGDKER